MIISEMEEEIMFIISEANPLGYSAMQTKTDNIRDIWVRLINRWKKYVTRMNY